MVVDRQKPFRGCQLLSAYQQGGCVRHLNIAIILPETPVCIPTLVRARAYVVVVG